MNKLRPYQIKMKFPIGNTDLREMYFDDRLVMGFYFTRNTIKPFEKYFSEYKDLRCVYILLNSHNPSKVYIGKTTDMRTRRITHSSSRDKENWWNIELAFTNNDFKNGGLTEGELSFLEYYLCVQAIKSGIKLPYNSQDPQEPPIDMISKYELIHQYYYEISQLCSSIGLCIFNDKSNYKVASHNTTNQSKLFYMDYDGGKAIASYDGNQMIVKKGSLISSRDDTKYPHYAKYRELIANGIIKNNRFAYDYPFNSPTEAGNIIAKHNMNGRINWKMKNGKTIKDIFG